MGDDNYLHSFLRHWVSECYFTLYFTFIAVKPDGDEKQHVRPGQDFM